MRIDTFTLALALLGAASGGCTMMDRGTEGSQTAEIGAPTPFTAFVLTVGADEAKITVTTTNSTGTCPTFTTCSFAFVAGTSVTVKTGIRNLIDCEQFIGWDGACAGQGSTCTLVINSDLSTDAVFGPIPGCVPQ